MIGELMAIEKPCKRDVSTLPDSAVLTAAEVAEYLRIHPNTARRMLRDGDIPTFLVGIRRRVRMGTLREWERQRTHSRPQK